MTQFQIHRHLAIILLVVLQCNTLTIAQTHTVTKEIDELMKASYPTHLPGAVVLVALDDQIIFQSGYGNSSLETKEAITPRHVFRIGSITKQFTAVAILKLVSEKKIQLDDPVTRFFPDYVQGKKVTIRHLLTHTSGIPSYTGILELQTPENKSAEKSVKERFMAFKHLVLEFEPGDRFQYTNSGYFMLGMIIEKVTGVTYGDYLKKEFFLPLQMTSTYYDGGSTEILPKTTGYLTREQKFVAAGRGHHSMSYAAGALASTAEDLFKWSRSVFTFRLLHEDIIAQAWEPARLSSSKEINYGFGWSLGRLDDLKVIYHGGAIDGYVSYALNIPSKKLFVVILTNRDEFGIIHQTEQISRIVLQKPMKNPPQIELPTPVLDDYTGIYKNDSDQLRVIMRKDNKLFSRDAYGDTLEIVAYRMDGFYIKEHPVKLDFERGQNKTVSSVKVTASDWIAGEEVKLDSALLPPKNSVRLDRSVFDKYIGTYEIAGGFSLKVWIDKDRYMVTSTLHGDFEMFAESETQFFIPGVNVAIEFLKDINNSVSALDLLANGTTSRGKKVQ